jgi:hypothetical protein
VTATAFTETTTPQPNTRDSALVSLIRDAHIPCAIEYPDKTTAQYRHEAFFTIHFRTWDALTTSPNQLAVAKAYMDGCIDVSGDFSKVMDVRPDQGMTTLRAAS